MPVPESILQLIERFEEHLPSYRTAVYNEAQTRREFIDPLFLALGWDMFNQKGYAEAYKEVVHEDAVKVDQATKAPDYAFRIGSVRKFFVEAKKPTVKLKEDTCAAYQLRRYAWSAKLPLSILTDFEEFAVYDCRLKPDKNDPAAVGRVLYLNYKDYPTEWDRIEKIFSREAILKGSFDQFAESSKGKRGTAEVDNAFLLEIERWRELLARNIALRNPDLNAHELNYAVQMTIDRLVFLRICEDRGMESYGQLQSLGMSNDVYRGLCRLFLLADDRYNSGLFHFQEEKGTAEAPDTLSTRLSIDDKVLKDILHNLYYPDCPYAFSVLPADILGQVYERFLGKVIRLTGGQRAVVEEKPEVKKAGGVYYTPTFIVDYIVQGTLGSLLQGKKPSDKGLTKGQPIRILDPACGSGSFLLGAYQFLLDWYLAAYLAEDPERWAKGRQAALYRYGDKEWRLTAMERKRILRHHIYGVDIDPQAVEVTKLSLLLKVLEGENKESLGKQLSLFRERALPNLSGNIRCGNSLIGPDFYADATDRLPGFVTEEERYQINTFDWRREFVEVFRDSGGFDIVIGNPPYVRQEALGPFKAYLEKNFKTYHGVADLYTYFIEKGVSLLHDQGIFAYIVANKWLRANYGEPLRHWLREQPIREIVDFGDLPVFQQATTYPCILKIDKRTENKHIRIARADTLKFGDLKSYVDQKSFPIDRSDLEDRGWTLAGRSVQHLLDRLKNTGIPLGEYVKGKIFYGIKTGLNEAFVIDRETKDRLIAEDPHSAEVIKPFLAGREIKRYQTPIVSKYLIFARRGIDIKQYPAIETHLRSFKESLSPRPKEYKGTNWKGRKPGSYKWYEIQDTVDYFRELEKPKIIFPDIAVHGNFTLDETGKIYIANTAYFLATADIYLLALLNSNLMTFYYRNSFAVYRGGYLRFFAQYLEQLPIRMIDFSDRADKERHDRVVALVGQMLELQKGQTKTKTPMEKTLLQRQIETVDRQIDMQVYDLYRLTPEEIKIVENG